MAIVACNDIAATEARIALPLVGAWHASLILAAGSGVAAGDAVSLSVGSGALTLHGTARRAAAFVDALQVQVVAGSGNLGALATAKSYRSATVRSVLSDLLGVSSDTLDAGADATLMATLLPNWITFARPVGVEVQALIAAVSPASSWRILPGGGLWIGSESWPDSGVACEVLERDERHGKITLASEAPLLLPGYDLDGDHIGDVEHVVTQHRVQSIAWVES